MSEINLLIASSIAAETGELLADYLRTRRVNPFAENSNRIVCYGHPATRTHGSARILNANCKLDKITRLKRMTAEGVSVVPWFTGSNIPAGFKFPALARKRYGHGGTDIVPVFQPEEIPWRIAAGWEWFSSYIPVDTEYRVWVWRGEVLDTYMKVLERPSEYTKIGRNFSNGFEFKSIADHLLVPRTAKDEALRAVYSLGLDFAAVDLIYSKTPYKSYVLEVNTAPGVIRSGAQATLAKLADRIAEWASGG